MTKSLSVKALRQMMHSEKALYEVELKSEESFVRAEVFWRL